MKIMLSLIILFLLQGCVALSNLGKPKPKLDQLQLQESIQRFYSRFTERIIEGAWGEDELKAVESSTLLNQYLLYDSEALKIATSPYPEMNLLDMLVFIKLNKAIVRRYWIPEVYGKAGLGILDAFHKSEEDINAVALQIMTKKQLLSINQGIIRWLKDNPNAIRVEKIRIADFSKLAKTNDSGDGFSFSISQIFVDTKSAVKAVDQVSLVGNRALFLAQHMPFLLRLHARIGSHEILTDSIHSFQSAPEKINETLNAANPVLENMVTFARDADRVLKDLKAILPDKNSPKRGNFNRTLAQMDSLVGKGSDFIEDVRLIKPENFKEHYREFIIFTATAVVFVATAISFVWWGGYYIAKRLLNSSKKEIT